jgi:hypothetical protein
MPGAQVQRSNLLIKLYEQTLCVIFFFFVRNSHELDCFSIKKKNNKTQMHRNQDTPSSFGYIGGQS